MLHARKDYNRIQDPENKIPEDEPVFLLRAQDQVAAEVVRYWAYLHKHKGGADDIAMLAIEQSRLMDEWPKHKSADL